MRVEVCVTYQQFQKYLRNSRDPSAANIKAHRKSTTNKNTHTYPVGVCAYITLGKTLTQYVVQYN